MRTWSAITLDDAFLRHELSVTVLLGSFDVGGVCSGLGGDPRGLLALPVGPVTVARLSGAARPPGPSDGQTVRLDPDGKLYRKWVK